MRLFRTATGGALAYLFIFCFFSVPEVGNRFMPGFTVIIALFFIVCIVYSLWLVYAGVYPEKVAGRYKGMKIFAMIFSFLILSILFISLISPPSSHRSTYHYDHLISEQYNYPVNYLAILISFILFGIIATGDLTEYRQHRKQEKEMDENELADIMAPKIEPAPVNSIPEFIPAENKEEDKPVDPGHTI